MLVTVVTTARFQLILFCSIFFFMSYESVGDSAQPGIRYEVGCGGLGRSPVAEAQGV